MGNKRYKDNRKLKGICVDCDEPVWQFAIRCREHVLLNRKQIKDKYYRYIEEGRCVTCGNPLNKDMDEGKRRCLNCREIS